MQVPPPENTPQPSDNQGPTPDESQPKGFGPILTRREVLIGGAGIAAHLALPDSLRSAAPKPPAESITNSLDMPLRYIPPGEFQMGSWEPLPWVDEHQDPRQVTITKGFYIGATVVTQQQWQDLMETTYQDQYTQSFICTKNRAVEGSDCPMPFVTAGEVEAFCERLSESEGCKYRLPTEAEWEYAYRAGSQTEYYFGDDPAELGDYAWYADNSGKRLHPVATKAPNAWGLYDMAGNLWEFCLDDYCCKGLCDGYLDPKDLIDPFWSGAMRQPMLRGGGCGHVARACGAAFRSGSLPSVRAPDRGFRVVLEVGSTQSNA